VFNFGKFIFIEKSFIVPLLMLFRYLVLLRIHLNKKKYSSMLKLGKEEDSKFKNISKALNVFLKVISSHWTILICPIIWLIFGNLLFFIQIAINNFQCDKNTANGIRLTHIFVIIFFFVFILALIFFDFLFNILKIIRCKWKDIFIKYDPYNYRLDMIHALMIIPLTILWSLYGFISYSNTFLGIILEIILFQGFFSTGILTFLITIFKKHYPFFECLKKRTSNDSTFTVNGIVEGPHIEIFVEYCEFEWSVENILFKLDVIKYKNLKLESEKEKLCKLIKERYLLLGISTLEINAPSGLIIACARKMDSRQFPDDLFKDLEKVVDMNLSDTFGRFIVSSQFNSHLKRLEEQEKELGLK
jgi:hypothetical protein